MQLPTDLAAEAKS